MNIILLQHVKGLGFAGDVVSVADGFGRNFLLPQGFAAIASKVNVERAATIRALHEAKESEMKAAAELLSTKLSDCILTITAKAKDGKLFGSISVKDIINALINQKNETVAKSAFAITEPIKTIGEHDIVLHLHPEISVTIKVLVKEE